MNAPVKLTLSTPIRAHGDDNLLELSFRPPTGKDVRVLGLPYALGQDGQGKSTVGVDTGVVARYIVELAQIPLSSVDQMSARDLSRAVGVVMGFFGDPEDLASPPSSEGTSSSPAITT